MKQASIRAAIAAASLCISVLAGCGGSSSASAPGGGTTPPPVTQQPAPITGVATPSSVAVVTATNAN